MTRPLEHLSPEAVQDMLNWMMSPEEAREWLRINCPELLSGTDDICLVGDTRWWSKTHHEREKINWKEEGF